MQRQTIVFCLLIILLATSIEAEAQRWRKRNSQKKDSIALYDPENLVYNPSFEEYTECPRRIDAIGKLSIVDGWYQPTGGSADYFNKCGASVCGVPRNKMGYQKAHTGDGYCGIYCNKTEYREYLQAELKEPLREGCTYEVTYYVSLAEYSTCAVATMGALFTDYRIDDTSRRILTKRETRSLGGDVEQTIATYHTPQVQHDAEHALADWHEWQMISGRFVANGGERFITIGNFQPSWKSGILYSDELGGTLTGSYYYIDDVSVRLIGCEQKRQPEQVAANKKKSTSGDERLDEMKQLKKGNTIVLKNIFFDFDKSTLLQQSYNELQRVIILLENNPKMKILIIGHTDNQGGKAYNQRLSENRAKAVVEYLIRKGIEPSRLQYKGRGAFEPIDTNTTEEGRAHNRRVEMKILEL